MNVQIVVECFFVLYFYIFHFFYFFSSDFASMLGVVVCTVYGLMAGFTVSARLPCSRFCPYFGWALTSTQLSDTLPPTYNYGYAVVER